MTIFIIPEHVDNSSIYSITCLIYGMLRHPTNIITSLLVYHSRELNALHLMCNLYFPSGLSYSAPCFQSPPLFCWLMKLNCDWWTFKSKATVCFVILKRSTSLTSTSWSFPNRDSRSVCSFEEFTPKYLLVLSVFRWFQVVQYPCGTGCAWKWKEIKSSQISCLVGTIPIYARQFLMRNRWEKKTGWGRRGGTLGMCLWWSRITGTEAKASLFPDCLPMPGGLQTESPKCSVVKLLFISILLSFHVSIKSLSFSWT